MPAKWAAKDNLHITLEFLGDMTDQEIADICFVVKEVADSQGPFSVNLQKIIYGPENKFPPKFIWALGEKSEGLSELKTNLQKALLEKIRFRPEEKIFSPHITLARISEWQFKKMEQEEVPEINKNIDLTFFVESIEVMESELKRGGPVYSVLESCELKS